MSNVNTVLGKFSIKSIALVLLVKFLFVNFAQAQDIHYSQFYNPVLILNPAKTGIFNGDDRFLLSYRDQWSSVPVPWRTFTASYDKKFYPSRSDNHFFSGGLSFNYDRQGDSNLSLSNLNLFGSYTKILNKRNLLTIGLGLGIASRAFDTENLVWDSQWNGATFDPGLPSLERFDAERVNFLENTLGINYRWQKNKRTKFDLGLGVYHLLEPGVGFYDEEDITLPRRYNLSGIFSGKLTTRLDLQLQALGQLQDEYNELLVGGLLKLYVNQNRGKETELHVGIGYRTSGSFFPTAALQYKERYYFSINFERDVSGFGQYTNGSAGFEAHFRYIIHKVKPLEQFKICPIY